MANDWYTDDFLSFPVMLLDGLFLFYWKFWLIETEFKD